MLSFIQLSDDTKEVRNDVHRIKAITKRVKIIMSTKIHNDVKTIF